jgi:hypothetical protein
MDNWNDANIKVTEQLIAFFQMKYTHKRAYGK